MRPAQRFEFKSIGDQVVSRTFVIVAPRDGEWREYRWLIGEARELPDISPLLWEAAR